MNGVAPGSAIQDKYPTQLKDAELEWMAQEAYFNELRDEFKPRMAYMLDNPSIKVTDLVEAVRHIEATTEWCCIQRQDASYYPASTSAKPVYQKDQLKDSNGKHNHNRGVINAKPVQIESDPSSEEEDPKEAERQRIALMKMQYGETDTTCVPLQRQTPPTCFTTCATTTVNPATDGEIVPSL